MNLTNNPPMNDFYNCIKADWACLPNEILDRLDECELPLSQWIYQQTLSRNHAFLMGINGPQGSGKSTTCDALETLLTQYFGLRVLVVSIDDFYLTKSQRQVLGLSIHPLLTTRGVPGTHDVALACSVLQALKHSDSGSVVSVPQFNKAIDDRCEPNLWKQVTTPVDVVLFEGWCVGAVSESNESLEAPINQLEENEDKRGVWRNYVNRALSEEYQALFGLLDALAVFEYGDFSWVYDWRKQQEIENEKRAIEQGMSTSAIMDDASLKRFILHYERITRSCQRSLPQSADVCIKISRDRTVESLKWRAIV